MASPQKSKLLPKQTKPYFEPPPQAAAKTPSIRGITLAILPFLGIFGFYSLYGLGFAGGLFDQISQLALEPAPLFPGTSTPLLLHYTGIQAVDVVMKNLVAFFAPIVDFRDAGCTLYSIYMFGQFGTGFALWLLEAARVGNKWQAALLTTVYGTLIQLSGWASTTPFYLFVLILISPLSKTFSASNPSSNVFVPLADLSALPFSIFFGYVVPSVLMCLSPRVHSPVMQQVVAAIWQPVPIYCILFQWIMTNVFLGGKRTKPTAQSYVAASRHYYFLVLLFCAGTHLFVVALALLPPSMFESWAPDLAWLASNDFVELFVPPLPVLSWRMRDYAHGVQVFMQYDTYFSAIPASLWATMLLRNVSTETNEKFYPRILVKILIWLCVAGPFGPVIALLQERDEIAAKKIKT